MEYQPRIVDEELDELMSDLPAIAIEGPRGVGKTATAARRAATAYYLDDPAQRSIAEANPRLILSGERPVLIDEWQRVPAVWDAVRRAVDRGVGPGSFLLTGSATPPNAPTHSGAGRIVSVRMRPMTMSERGIGTPLVSVSSLLSGTRDELSGSTDITLTDYVREIVRSGFPGIRVLSGRALRRQLDGYVGRIIDTDFEEQGHPVRRPEILSAWITAYAAATATTASFETIRDAATGGQGEKPAKTTTQPYRDVLQKLWVLDPVLPWLPSRNMLKRLGQSPKHHLAEPALAVRALGLDEEALLSGNEPATQVPKDGTLLGNLFESLVSLCVRVYAQASEAHLRHFRLHGGRREIDLVIERSDRKVVAMEVKLSGAVHDGDVKNLLWLQEQISGDLLDAIVVNTGPYAYRRSDGIGVVPAALLGA